MTGQVRAPSIDRKDLRWFNVEKPVSLNALRGRLVILDFWTFCCINCMHVLPTLAAIEDRFPEDVAVIGVHSPKFKAERDPANVEQAIARYGIRHPVIHDPDMTLWHEYAVRAWPTLVFVDPAGYVLGQVAGEPNRDKLIGGIEEMLADFRADGTLKPAHLPLTAPKVAGGRLSFPGKIKPVPGTPKRWAIADAGHHQVVVIGDDGKELARFGSGAPGFADGIGKEAAFNAPQGLVATTDAIFVADTGNHRIRRIDLASGTVDTLAGTGERGRGLPKAGGDDAHNVSLASPWDLEILANRLFFANAGTHQLGEIDLKGGTVRLLAGSGAEDVSDGRAFDARLAQPSGLALSPDGQALYFADSETSAARVLHLDGAPRVETLIGRGLFDFGHANGPFATAKLQHPLGVAWSPTGLIVADSYNGRLRRLDLVDQTAEDVGEAEFDCEGGVCYPSGEPAGVWADGPDRLLVADTNNHRIVEVLPRTRTVRTLFA